MPREARKYAESGIYCITLCGTNRQWIAVVINTMLFTYDADGMRTGRSNGATAYSYIYTGGQLTQMTVGSNTLTFTYDATGTPLAVTYNDTTYYYAVNLQGDVVAILDRTGTAMVSYTYDAWGNPFTTTGTLATTLGAHNPLRYRGYVYDTETGLYYLQSRYYNPLTGRFLNADALVSTGQGLLGNNMFAYCGNNPVNGADPAGYRVESKPILFEFAWPYIYNQKDPGVGELRFGVVTVAHGGCGAVATYNALVSMGHGVPFGQVLEYYNDHVMQMLLFGAAGMLPETVADYFWDHGYVVFTTDDPEMIDYFSTTADACIMWYTFTSDSLPFVGGHFVEYSRTSDGYVGRNVYGGTRKFAIPSEFAYIDPRFYARGIFIYRKERVLRWLRERNA